jgi:tripartite-type tricarboxylate transporter receptor subunit TctC
MLRIRNVAGLLLAACLGTGAAYAQAFPDQPITIVTTPAGGGADFGARLIAQGMTEILGQPVVVENRASGPIATQVVGKSKPDGYTILYQGSAQWLYPLMSAHQTYDPVKDFEPVALTTATPSILVVNASLPVNSVRELIDLAKSQPGKLNFASGGVGSSYHLAAALFNSMAGIDIVHVPYGGGGPAVLAVLGNEVQVLFAPGGSVQAHIKAKKVKALGIATDKPSPLAPGLTTIADAGVPGYQATNYNGFFAPAKTPKVVIQKLNEAIVQVLNRPDVKAKFAATGVDTVGGTPEDFAKTMQADMARMGKVIKDAGIKAD